MAIVKAQILSEGGFTAHAGKLAEMHGAHCHDEFEFSMFPAGTQRSMIGGQLVTLHAGDISLFWAAVPHRAVRVIRPGRFVLVNIPLTWFMNCPLPPGLITRTLQGEMLIERSPHARFDEWQFHRWRSDLTGNDPEQRKIAQQEIESRLRRMALNLQPARDARALAGEQEFERDVVLEMTRFIAKNFASELSVVDVAAAVKLHPDYAARLFRNTWGMSPTAFVSRCRLVEAQRLLATTAYKIVDLAGRAGFGSVSQFYAEFQKALGCTPRHYRRVFAGNEPPPPRGIVNY